MKNTPITIRNITAVLTILLSLTGAGWMLLDGSYILGCSFGGFGIFLTIIFVYNLKEEKRRLTSCTAPKHGWAKCPKCGWQGDEPYRRGCSCLCPICGTYAVNA